MKKLTSRLYISDNKDVSIYSKLWERVKNGSRHQKKRKDRKDKKICRKNKKDIRRSWSSVKKVQKKMKQ